MSAAKTLFLRDENLVKSSLAIIKSDDFEKLIVYATAEFMSLQPDLNQVIGASRFITTLKDMVNKGEEEQSIVGPELTHDLEVKRKSLDNPDKENK